MNRRIWALIALSLCFALAALAADKPDFTGNWKLNVSKSDLGQMPAPDKWEMKVEHKEPALKSVTTSVGQMGERVMEANYKTDGTETTNKGFGNSETKSTAKWDGSILAIATQAEFQGNKMEINSRWSLAADGKTLTVEQTMKSERGEFTTKRVLDKQ
jgi:hypothetical protein